MTTSGQILRSARMRSAMTQADVAQRAGVTQSVVSDYERDRRSPALETLTRLVAATGQQLDVRLAGPGAVTVPEGRLATRLRAHRDEAIALASARGATNVRVFGSVARGDEREDSDIDLLVDLAPGTGLIELISLRHELEDLLGAPVDVVPADSLKTRTTAAVMTDVRPL